VYIISVVDYTSILESPLHGRCSVNGSQCYYLGFSFHKSHDLNEKTYSWLISRYFKYLEAYFLFYLFIFLVVLGFELNIEGYFQSELYASQAGDMAQAVEYLPSKGEALSLKWKKF
jgi:hypothetical protein